MKEEGNAFGRRIRAARLGYHLDREMKAWLRVRAGGPPHIVDVVPELMLVPCSPPHKGDEHVVWWDDGAKTLTHLSPALKELGQPTVPHQLYLDDNGNKIK